MIQSRISAEVSPVEEPFVIDTVLPSVPVRGDLIGIWAKPNPDAELCWVTLEVGYLVYELSEAGLFERIEISCSGRF